MTRIKILFAFVFSICLFSGCVKSDLKYDDVSQFYGTWYMNYGDGSFAGSYKEKNILVKIYPDGTLNYDNHVSEWRVEENTFYWGILNYKIQSFNSNEFSLVRKATHLIFTRVPQ